MKYIVFCHDRGVVNIVENYKNTFFLNLSVVNVVAKSTLNGVPNDIQIFFSLWSHQESHVVNVVAVVMT